MHSLRKSAFRGAVLVLALATAAPAQVGGPPTGPATIWSFLGIPQGIRKIQGATRNRRGNHPALEPKPPLKALADPANLESPDPSIKKAAEVKQAEDLKKQKIKAVKYLASIGCGCYDVDGGVTAALVASMQDCTEDVRYETIKAVAEAAENGSCAKCGEGCCCNKEILTQLAKMAYERDDHGCYLEPSERVREAAAEALVTCCPNNTSPVIVAEEPPVKAPDRETLDDKPKADSRETVPVPPVTAPPNPPPPVEELPTGNGFTGVAPGQPVQFAVPPQSSTGAAANSQDYGFGVVVHVSPPHELAHVHFHDPKLLVAPGAMLGIYQQDGDKRLLLARLQVVEAFAGSANVTGSHGDLSRIVRGDVVLNPPVRLTAHRSADVQPPPVETVSTSVAPTLPKVAASYQAVRISPIALPGAKPPQADVQIESAAVGQGGIAAASSVAPLEPVRRKATAPAIANRMSPARKPSPSGFVR